MFLALIETRRIMNEINQIICDETLFTKLYVGGLAQFATQKSVREYFLNFGDVEDVILMSERESGRCRGFGFVTMADEDGAKRAYEEKNPMINGRPIRINLAYLGARNAVQFQMPPAMGATPRFPPFMPGPPRPSPNPFIRPFQPPTSLHPGYQNFVSMSPAMAMPAAAASFGPPIAPFAPPMPTAAQVYEYSVACAAQFGNGFNYAPYSIPSAPPYAGPPIRMPNAGGRWQPSSTLTSATAMSAPLGQNGYQGAYGYQPRFVPPPATYQRGGYVANRYGPPAAASGAAASVGRPPMSYAIQEDEEEAGN